MRRDKSGRETGFSMTKFSFVMLLAGDGGGDSNVYFGYLALEG
jgi:hypothetical protein